MAVPIVLAQSRTVPFPLEQAFAFTLPAPLPAIFSRWWGPLPPIVDVDGPEPWGEVGEVRRIRTADGASMREELLSVDAPNRFTYRLTEVALRFLVASVDGSWSFEPVGTGTRVEWSWTIHSASDVASFVLPVVGLLWKGYARRALDRLDEMMVAELG
jgi:hypothetical protein